MQENMCSGWTDSAAKPSYCLKFVGDSVTQDTPLGTGNTAAFLLLQVKERCKVCKVFGNLHLSGRTAV